MANMFKVWDTEDGETEDDMFVRVLYFYDIDPVITTADNLLVRPTPAASVPQEILDLGLVTADELEAMDAGTLLGKLGRPVRAKRSDKLGAIAARVTKAYLDERDDVLRELRQRYRHTGRSTIVEVP